MQKDKTTVHFLWILPKIYVWNNIDMKISSDFLQFFSFQLSHDQGNHAGDNLHK